MNPNDPIKLEDALLIYWLKNDNANWVDIQDVLWWAGIRNNNLLIKKFQLPKSFVLAVIRAFYPFPLIKLSFFDFLHHKDSCDRITKWIKDSTNIQ
jgi:hypothetical protein